jgi:arylformamidase
MPSNDDLSGIRVTRRTLVGGGAAVLGAGGPALAQRAAQPPRAKGPVVWLDMDQQELDDAYDQIVYAPNRDHILKRCTRNSEIVRERLGAPKRFAYGTGPMEALDVFTTKAANAPVNVFVHGGAWRTGLAVNYAYAAEMFVNAGAHHVVLDFNNVLETGGDLMVMAQQVRSGVAWVYRNAASFGGDAERLYVCGHSSGGHLAGVLLTTDWQKDFGLPPGLIKGGVCGSGMFDLKPARLSKRSEYVKFTDETEDKLSPPPRSAGGAGAPGLRHAGNPGIPAPEPRFRCRGKSRRQAGGAVGDGKLQPLRGDGAARQSLQPFRPRGPGADAARAGLTPAARQRGRSGIAEAARCRRIASQPV